MRGERPGRDHVEKAWRPRDDPSIPAETSLRTGESADVVPNEPLEPVQAQFRAIDRPGPSIPGDVPVEAVLVRPETDLPPRQVVDRVGVDPGRDEPVGVADADAHPVLQSRHLRRDGVAVETDVLQDKAGGRARSPRARVVGREIAVEAVPDLRPQHSKADRLGDLEAAVRLQLHIAEEVEDALGLGIRGGRGEEQQRQRQRDPGGLHRSAESDLRRGARRLIAQLEIAR
jgi:hypothetical protein